LTYPTPYATFLRTNFRVSRSKQMPFGATGRYLPNRMVFHFQQALEETIGRVAVERIWNGAEGRERCFPPATDDLEKSFDFSCFSALCSAVENVYGEAGTRGILFRSGRAALSRTLRSTASIVGLDGPQRYAQSGAGRIVEGLPSVLRLLGLISDMEWSMEMIGWGCSFRIAACPECVGRTGDAPFCHGVSGMLRGVLDWIGVDPAARVAEDECAGSGAGACRFSIAGAC
jgi:predicted hydrocarbon binding protein